MNRLTALATLAILAFGGYIGYSTNYVEPATANEIVLPRFTDIPRNTGFNLDINLNKNAVSYQNSTEQDIKVNVQKKDSIVYKYKYLVKYKEPKCYVIRMVPPVKPKPVSCSDVLAGHQKQLEKINLSRN